MSGFSFYLTPVDEIPKRRYRKGSKYDSVIDKFLDGNDRLVTVEVVGRGANYIRTQLKKRIEARGLGDKVEASFIDDKAYLEKL